MSWLSTARQWIANRRNVVMDLFTDVAGGGQQWPPEDHVDRLRAYAQYTDLYLGEHEKVFVTSGLFKFKYDDSREYVLVNLLGALTDLLTSRLFGEAVRIRAPEEAEGTQAFFDHLLARNRMARANVEQGMGASYRGDAVYKVRYDADEQRIVIEVVPPSLWFPVMDDLDGTKIIGGVIGQVVWQNEDPFLWLEGHEMREGSSWITNTVFRLHQSTGSSTMHYDPEKDRTSLENIDALAQIPEEQRTGVDQLLLVHVPNRTTTETKAWGISDYAGLISLQGELNNRLTQRSEVQDKFVDPFMWGPRLDDEKGEVNLRQNKYIPVPDEAWGAGAPVGMLVWDAELVSVADAIRDMRQDFATTAGIDLAALRPDESGGPASGRAMRLQQSRTQDRVKGKQRTFGPGLQDVFSVATKLALVEDVQLAWSPSTGEIQVLEPEEIVVEFSEGIPVLRMEDVEEEALMLASGVQSRAQAITALHDLTDEEAQALLVAIQQEAAATAPLPPEGAGLGPTFETAPREGSPPPPPE